MSNEVIDRVHKLARRSAAALMFADRDRVIIPDDDDDNDNDPDYAPGAAEEDDNDDDIEHDDIAGVFDDDGDDGDVVPDNNHYPMVNIALMGEPEQAQAEGKNPALQVMEEDPAFEAPIEDNPAEIEAEPLIDDENTDQEDGNDAFNAADDGDEEEEAPKLIPLAGNEAIQAPIQHNEETDDAIYGQQSGRYDLLPRRPRDYAHLHAILEHTVFTQRSMKRGLAEYGDAGVQAVLK